MSATDYSPANGHSSGFDGPATPPQNLEAEQSVLGAVLLSDTALPALIIDERLQAADFYRESHGLIFTAMLELHGAGEPVDALTLVEHLKQAGQLDAVGGRATVDLLAGSVPAVGNVRQYARIVRENAMLRRLLNAAYEIQSQGPLPRGARRASSSTSPSARSSRSPTRTPARTSARSRSSSTPRRPSSPSSPAPARRSPAPPRATRTSTRSPAASSPAT